MAASSLLTSLCPFSPCVFLLQYWATCLQSNVALADSIGGSWARMGWVECLADVAGLDGWEVGFDSLTPGLLPGQMAE
jgi:hypothetical protein